MLDIVIWVLTALDVIVALLLIPLILVQKTKDGGFGSSFGGMGESVFGAHAAGHLTKLTVILATTFLVVTLSLTVISGHRSAPKKGLPEINPELFKTDPVDKTAAEKNGKQNAVNTEALPDGTVKVPGGTIRMTKVEKPADKTNPPAGDKKEQAPPPAKPEDSKDAPPPAGK